MEPRPKISWMNICWLDDIRDQNTNSAFHNLLIQPAIYTLSHKNGANLFLFITSWKINGF